MKTETTRIRPEQLFFRSVVRAVICRVKSRFFILPALLVLSVMIPAKGFSAKEKEKPDFTRTDQTTYRLYQEKKWDSLILVGREAIRQNIDYYYLRVRIGIALVEKKKYITAIDHFNAALGFNSGDPVATEYLYYCYLWSNHPADARALLASVPEETRKTLSPERPVIADVHLEGGATLTNSEGPGGKQEMKGTGKIYTEQDRYGNSYYAHADISLFPWNRVLFNVGYSYLNFSKTKSFGYSWVEDRLVSKADCTWGYFNHYSFDTLRTDTSFKYNVHQNELHLEATVTFPGGIRIIPAFHLIRVSYPDIQAHYRSYTVTDTLYYTNYNQYAYTFDFNRSVYSLTRQDTSFFNFVAGLSVIRDFSVFSLGLFGSWSNLNGLEQTQVGLSLSYYPWGNLDFYGNTTLTGFFQGDASRILLNQMIGAKITPWLWAEGNLLWGDYTNANLYNAALVYNNSDKIDYKLGANLIFIASKHLQFSLIYQFSRKEYQQLYYINSTDPVSGEVTAIPQTKNIPYPAHSIIGGVTWKP